MEENQTKTEVKDLFISAKESILGDSNAPPPKVTFLNGFSAVFNGLGIGLLLGILLGLSVSPVVSGVIATISSLLAVLVGLNEKFLDPLKSLRIGAFGLFAVVGILLGLYIRANDLFAPTLTDKMEEYLAVGFTQDEAKSLLTGFILADSGKVIREAGVLYSSEIELGSCDFLAYANEQTEIGEILNTFQTAGGIWKEFSIGLENNLPYSIQGTALLILRDSFCKEGKSTISGIETVLTIQSNDSLKAMENKLNRAGADWQSLVESSKSRLGDTDRKAYYLAIRNSLAA